MFNDRFPAMRVQSKSLSGLVLVLASCLACLFGVACTSSAFAQDSKNISYLEALRLIYAAHPLIQQKRSDVRAAELGTTVAERQHWPTPSFSTNTGSRYVAPGTTLDGETTAITARLSIPLYTGGLLTIDQKMAAVRWQLAEIDLRQNSMDVSLQFVDLYRQWWQFTRREQVVRQTMGRLETLREMMERRAVAGVSSEVDLQLTNVHISRMQDELSQTMHARDQALNDMRVMLGKPVQLQFETLDDFPLWTYQNVNELSEQVLGVSSSVRYADTQTVLTRLEVDRTRASAFPTISLRIDRQWGAYYGSLPPGERLSLDSQMSLGAGLSSLQQEEQAVARVSSSQQQAAAVRQRTETQVTRLWNDHNQALNQLANVQGLVVKYEDITGANLRLFSSGRRSWLDLLNIQRESHQLNVQLVDTQSAIVSARLRMAVLTGLIRMGN
ncbi:MAG: TolC family protein [Rhodoferax sp.]|nr:TolC family protein [Rhodoferax sp.]